MSLTAHHLYRDTVSVFRRQFKTLLLLSLFAALITTILISYSHLPTAQLTELFRQIQSSNSAFEYAKNMSTEQQRLLLHSTAVLTVSMLIGNSLLFGSVFEMLSSLTQGPQKSALRCLSGSLSMLPRLFIQGAIISFLVQLGSVALLLPGLFLLVLLSLAPIIMLNQKGGIFISIKQSCRLSFQHLRLLAPLILIWFLLKLMINSVVQGHHLMNEATLALLNNLLCNLLTAFVIIFVYRLHKLIRQ